MRDINKIAAAALEVAKSKGYWESGTDHHISAVANMHSEISELFEAYKKNKLNDPCDKDIPLTCEQEECADIIMQMLECCAYYNINIEQAIALKMEYNKSREWRHGGKLA